MAAILYLAPAFVKAASAADHGIERSPWRGTPVATRRHSCGFATRCAKCVARASIPVHPHVCAAAPAPLAAFGTGDLPVHRHRREHGVVGTPSRRNAGG